MPFVLIALGLLLVVVGIRNTYAQLGAQVVQDFTGPGNFFYWIVALFLIGAVGYIDALKEASDLMLALVADEARRNTRFLTKVTAHGTPPERVLAWVDATAGVGFAEGAAARTRWFSSMPAAPG